MGVSSNLELVFLPKKHPKDHSLVRPSMETPTKEVRGQEQEQEKQLNDTDDHVLSALISLDLKIKIPSYKEAAEEDLNDDEGLKTPTSPEHRIPATLPCPPAPRKPKSQLSKKRKDQFALDVSQEIESYFSSQFKAAAENKKIKVFTNW